MKSIIQKEKIWYFLFRLNDREQGMIYSTNEKYTPLHYSIPATNSVPNSKSLGRIIYNIYNV